MAYHALQFSPGLNTELTPTLNKTGWANGNLIRFPAFSNGLPEVIGGWILYLMGQTLQGVCRGLHSWATLGGIATLGAGTSARLYVCQDQVAYDVTPSVKVSALSSPYATVTGSRTVTVTDSYVPNVGDIIEASGATAFNGVTMNGEFVVQSVGSGTYTVLATTFATGTGSGGGAAVSISYLLPVGLIYEQASAGYGLGTYGTGTYGTARPPAGGYVGPSIWAIDNWGEQMVACRAWGNSYALASQSGGSPIFVWPPTGYTPPPTTYLSTRASFLNGTYAYVAATCGPPQANGVLVAMPNQQLVAWGCSVPNPVSSTWGAQDPMMICWTDFSNYQTWFASATNAAGSFRITQGSQIMQCIRAQNQIMIWTDTAVVAMQFLGLPLVWGFTQLGTSCGAISPKAAVVIGGQAFWWSAQNFFTYNGTVSVLPCPIRDIVLSNVDFTGQAVSPYNTMQICASVNQEFQEVQWEYPSINSTTGENDSYVSYNFANGSWGYGVLTNGVPVARTARIDQDVFGYPVGTDAQGNIWLHENGQSAGSSYVIGVGPTALPWSLQSGFADLAEGGEYIFVDQLISDSVGPPNGVIGLTVLTQNYPSDGPLVSGPFLVGPTTFPQTTYTTLRARGRQIAVKFANVANLLQSFWRLGRIRVRTAPDGKR